MDLETTRAVAVGAAVLAGGIGVALITAVLGAMLEAAFPGWGTQVWVGTISALSVALSVFSLVAGICVTYLHTYRGDQPTDRPEADGRHRPGFGRRFQPAGRHRAMA